MTSLLQNPVEGRLKILASIAGISLAVAPLTGCGVKYAAVDSEVSTDYKVNHPIVLAHDVRTLDIFAIGVHLDDNAAGRIREFAAAYRGRGEGRILILAPVGSGASVDVVRRELASAGLRGDVAVGTYRPADPSLASPIRLRFQTVRAAVPTPCGRWPTDLASGSSLETWANKPYWNIGCATQKTLAAQIDDPRDLVASRGDDPADSELRMHAIAQMRTGADPSIKWNVKNASIGSVGGN